MSAAAAAQQVVAGKRPAWSTGHAHTHRPAPPLGLSPLAPSQKRAGAKGFGLFANADLAAGQFLIEYLGEVLEEEEYHRRYSVWYSVRYGIRTASGVDACCGAGPD